MNPRLRHATSHHVRRKAICRKAQQRHSHFYARCTHWSFYRNAIAAPIRWGRERWVLSGGGLLLALLTLVGLPAWAHAMRHPAEPVARTTLALKLPALPMQPSVPAVEDWQVTRVQAGETLADIFHDHNLAPADLARVLSSGKDVDALKRIHPGDEIAFLLGSSGELRALRFDRDAATRVTLHFENATGPLVEEITPRDVEHREHIAHGVIQGSLFAAGSKAGMSNAMILKLAKVFGYDIDFAQDLQPGDSFTVIYDDVYRDGEYLHEGDIIAAEFVNDGKRYTAVRFENPETGDVSYYSADGRPLKKSFLRTPVDFTRISSTFGMREHPILDRMKMHKGVDYAAPMGTPIYAAGDGVIKFRGQKHGYGNFVIIQHNKDISTAYGHMSRFAAGESVGEHVRQGQVIGYVGMTGMATGPHLHYEFRVDGEQRNPLTVTLPKPEPLSGKLMAQFREQYAPLMARIQMIDARRLAIATGKNDGNRNLD
ncbi:MAG TPA: peptidoglycan DD-metalloendopeptidase family protein [Rhodanobacteraceae bacterium]|nr:peptidoglycan DD-metalloendopeptidase family protein [Rhodanobacteraceae bacterium]